MNIIEAVKSGRPFKRPNHTNWAIINPNRHKEKDGVEISLRNDLDEIIDHFPFVNESDGGMAILNPSAILADDWRIKKETKKIKLFQYVNSSGAIGSSFYTDDFMLYWDGEKLEQAKAAYNTRKWSKTNCFIEVEVDA